MTCMYVMFECVEISCLPISITFLLKNYYSTNI